MRGNEKQFKETRLIIVLLAVIIILLFGIIILLLARGDNKAPVLEPNKVEKKEDVEETKEETYEDQKIENKINYKELDLSNECFNKKESCNKSYELEIGSYKSDIKIEYTYRNSKSISDNNETFIMTINNKEIFNSPYGDSVSKVYLLENGMIILENPDLTRYRYYSADYNQLLEIPTEVIKNNNFKEFEYENAKYSIVDNNTIEVEKEKKSENTNIGNKSDNLSFLEKTMIENKEYTLSNGKKDITFKITNGNLFINNTDIKAINNEERTSIQEIALLDNGLIIIKYIKGTSSPFVVNVDYLQEDYSLLLKLYTQDGTGTDISSNIVDKDIILNLGESGCTINYEDRMIHVIKYKLLNNYKYQISAVDTKYAGGCVGQS